MSCLFLNAYLALIYLEICMSWQGFAVLCDKVRDQPIARNSTSRYSVAQICSALDMACIWYWKKVLCLQRSAATARLLKHYGVDSQLIIGVQQVPFRAHAWVEVNGRIVNDKDYTGEMYVVLDRC